MPKGVGFVEFIRVIPRGLPRVRHTGGSRYPGSPTGFRVKHGMTGQDGGGYLEACREVLHYDEEKSRQNKDKHGIDFVEAQRLWDDVERVEIPAKTDDEERSIVIGLIGRRHWSAVITRRGDKTRIVSVRRSRREEIHIYES